MSPEDDTKAPQDTASSEVSSSRGKNKAGKTSKKTNGDGGYGSARESIPSSSGETPQHDVRAATTHEETYVKKPVEDDEYV